MASIFVAYEGFELLSYDYDDLARPRWTLPRALYLSVAIVTLVYITFTIGSQMLVSDEAIVAQKEVAFAAAGQAALGTAGYWIARAKELPAAFAKARAGLPVTALVFLAVFGATNLLAARVLPGFWPGWSAAPGSWPALALWSSW